MTEVFTPILDQLPIIVGSFLGAAVQNLTLRQRKIEKGSQLNGLIQVFIGWSTAFFLILAIEGILPKNTDWKIIVGSAFVMGNVGYRLAVWLSKGMNPLRLLPGARQIELEKLDSERESSEDRD